MQYVELSDSSIARETTRDRHEDEEQREDGCLWEIRVRETRRSLESLS